MLAAPVPACDLSSQTHCMVWDFHPGPGMDEKTICNFQPTQGKPCRDFSIQFCFLQLLSTLATTVMKKCFSIEICHSEGAINQNVKT